MTDSEKLESRVAGIGINWNYVFELVAIAVCKPTRLKTINQVEIVVMVTVKHQNITRIGDESDLIKLY
jgi:hypothetical protein